MIGSEDREKSQINKRDYSIYIFSNLTCRLNINCRNSCDIEMDDNDFKAFLRFKEFYELAD